MVQIQPSTQPDSQAFTRTESTDHDTPRSRKGNQQTRGPGLQGSRHNSRHRSISPWMHTRARSASVASQGIPTCPTLRRAYSPSPKTRRQWEAHKPQRKAKPQRKRAMVVAPLESPGTRNKSPRRPKRKMRSQTPRRAETGDGDQRHKSPQKSD